MMYQYNVSIDDLPYALYLLDKQSFSYRLADPDLGGTNHFVIICDADGTQFEQIKEKIPEEKELSQIGVCEDEFPDEFKDLFVDHFVKYDGKEK